MFHSSKTVQPPRCAPCGRDLAELGTTRARDAPEETTETAKTTRQLFPSFFARYSGRGGRHSALPGIFMRLLPSYAASHHLNRAQGLPRPLLLFLRCRRRHRRVGKPSRIVNNLIRIDWRCGRCRHCRRLCCCGATSSSASSSLKCLHRAPPPPNPPVAEARYAAKLSLDNRILAITTNNNGKLEMICSTAAAFGSPQSVSIIG